MFGMKYFTHVERHSARTTNIPFEWNIEDSITCYITSYYWERKQSKLFYSFTLWNRYIVLKEKLAAYKYELPTMNHITTV